VGDIDTYASAAGIVGFDVTVPDDEEPHLLWIEHTGTHNASATPDPHGNYRAQVSRKRLSEEEVNAITDLRQAEGSGQLEMQRGDGTDFVPVPTANNVRVDGTVQMTGALRIMSDALDQPHLVVARQGENAPQFMMREKAGSDEKLDAASLEAHWFEATDAVREGEASLVVYDANGGRTILRGRADLTDARLAVLGNDPLPKQTLTGERDGNAALAAMITAMAAFGWVVDETVEGSPVGVPSETICRYATASISEMWEHHLAPQLLDIAAYQSSNPTDTYIQNATATWAGDIADWTTYEAYEQFIQTLYDLETPDTILDFKDFYDTDLSPMPCAFYLYMDADYISEFTKTNAVQRIAALDPLTFPFLDQTVWMLEMLYLSAFQQFAAIGLPSTPPNTACEDCASELPVVETWEQEFDWSSGSDDLGWSPKPPNLCGILEAGGWALDENPDGDMRVDIWRVWSSALVTGLTKIEMTVDAVDAGNWFIQARWIGGSTVTESGTYPTGETLLTWENNKLPVNEIEFGIGSDVTGDVAHVEKLKVYGIGTNPFI